MPKLYVAPGQPPKNLDAEGTNDKTSDKNGCEEY